jgi:hypothetical protein
MYMQSTQSSIILDPYIGPYFGYAAPPPQRLVSRYSGIIVPEKRMGNIVAGCDCVGGAYGGRRRRSARRAPVRRQSARKAKKPRARKTAIIDASALAPSPNVAIARAAKMEQAIQAMEPPQESFLSRLGTSALDVGSKALTGFLTSYFKGSGYYTPAQAALILDQYPNNHLERYGSGRRRRSARRRRSVRRRRSARR